MTFENEQVLRGQICEIGQLMHQFRLIDGAGGIFPPVSHRHPSHRPSWSSG